MLSAPNPAATIEPTNAIRHTSKFVKVIWVASVDRNRVKRKMYNKLAA
jgi:hypothetical protein